MNNLVRVVLLVTLCAGVAVILPGCSKSPPITLVQAPPGPADLGPATGLSTPPADAVVFDLKYLPQTGGAGDVEYHSYWGYGGSTDEAKTNSFLQDVRKKSSRLYYVENPSFKGREWAAVEYNRRQALALYFDLNGDGKLEENERISPTRKADRAVDFITPDFMNELKSGGQVLCRTLLRVKFYDGSSEPNCTWSPAVLLEGTATLNGQSTRLLLYAAGPGGGFDEYGSSSYSLLPGKSATNVVGQYIPRETLSSLLSSEGQFYHLTIDGRRSNGLPARALLVKDPTPTGSLVVKLVGSNTLQGAISTLYLHGVDDKTVFLRVGATKKNVVLPEGSYALHYGVVAYGASNADWDVSFSQGPRATIKAGEPTQIELGQPTLTVRAIKETDRYNREVAGSTTFKKGMRIYLEPKLVGKGQEVFSRFRQTTMAKNQKTDRPPNITITSPDGKQVLSSTMEYG